jgi:hypothetical protein
VLTVLLTPTERDAVAPKIAIGNYKIVRLRIKVPEGYYESYRAILKADDRTFQREFTGLSAIPGHAGVPQLQVEIPSSLLPPGEYTLEVSGVTSAGGAEPAEGYGFSVTAK